MVSYGALLAVVALERLFELLLSRRNAAAAFARGGVETGAAHFRVMTLMHAAFLPCCFLEAWLLRRPFPGALGWAALGLALAAQALRWWAVGSLGSRWNVRIIVVPGDTPVRSGPYRWVKHPNYVAVALEMVGIPLIHGAWLSALLFSALNALVLRTRIAEEERALGSAYAAAFQGVPRFVPGAPHG